MGTAGGFVWHYVKGLRNSPKLPNDPLARKRVVEKKPTSLLFIYVVFSVFFPGVKAGIVNGQSRCLRVGGSFGQLAKFALFSVCLIFFTWFQVLGVPCLHQPSFWSWLCGE